MNKVVQKMRYLLSDAKDLLLECSSRLSYKEGNFKKDIKDYLSEVEEFSDEYEEELEEDFQEEDDCEEEETKPVIQIATSNPYVEKTLSVLEGFLGKMGDSSNANSWPTEVRLRAAELILNYHKE